MRRGPIFATPCQEKLTFMSLQTQYSEQAPSREELDALPGPTLVEFGTDWCGHCRAAQPPLAEAFAQCPELRHLKVEDGPGRRLGRSFRVKLWPTLIFMRDGQEIDRLVRPRNVEEISEALQRLTS